MLIDFLSAFYCQAERSARAGGDFDFDGDVDLDLDGSADGDGDGELSQVDWVVKEPTYRQIKDFSQ